jgi:uncharacterized protein CbrC (UPF0167 family)
MKWVKKEPRSGEGMCREDGRVCAYVAQEKVKTGSVVHVVLRTRCYETEKVKIVAGTPYFPETAEVVTCPSCVAAT